MLIFYDFSLNSLKNTVKFRKRPFLRDLFLEGLIYGGKFAFQN